RRTVYLTNGKRALITSVRGAGVNVQLTVRFVRALQPPPHARRIADAEPDASRTYLVGIGVVTAELLRRKRISRAGGFCNVAHIAVIPLCKKLRRKAHVVQGERHASLRLLILETVPCVRRKAESRDRCQQAARAERQPFNPVHAYELGQPAPGQCNPTPAIQRSRPNELLGTRPHEFNVLLSRQPDILGNGINHQATERIAAQLVRRQRNDLRPDKTVRRQRLVHLVAADLPTSANNPARRKIEPARSSGHFKL